MNPRQLFSIVGAAAMLAAPVAASAQQQPYGWSQNANAQVSDRQFFDAVRSLNLRQDQRDQIRSIENSGGGQDARRQIIGVLDQNQRRDLFNRLRGNGSNGNWNNGNSGRDRDGDQNGNGNGRWNGQGRNGNWNGQGGYGRRGGMNNGQVSGIVSSFGGYNLQLQNGTAVSLHQGTVINPTGTTLTPGMRVSIRGSRNSAGGFNADEIDVLNR
jgi:hypothetical protein